ncbi:MAG: hypothetical protein ABIK15_17880 [Pseudomonadota bacterium]
MCRFLSAVCLAILVSTSLFAGDKPEGISDLHDQMVPVLQELSENIDALNDIQKQMDNSKASDENYDEKKNIWLSSVLTFSAIGSVCEYEQDLLELFLDLRPQNRMRYVNVRIKSIESSIRQIEIFKEQIVINRLLLGENQSNRSLFELEDHIIGQSLSLLKKGALVIRTIK